MALGPNGARYDRERDLADALELKIDEWLTRQEASVNEHAYGLPWYAHENSRVLELLIPRYSLFWREIRVRRGTGCLELVFCK